MNRLSRREVLIAGALGAMALPFGRAWGQRQESSESIGHKYITSYYQFTDEAVKILADKALPNGPEYLH
ncbi:MAG TPA: hypothetical protein VFW23_13020, partial [Tepidisphaeraceae bacterium]|nr:hypothetical protein [Tepidisphaeraceae bacterium]